VAPLRRSWPALQNRRFIFGGGGGGPPGPHPGPGIRRIGKGKKLHGFIWFWGGLFRGKKGPRGPRGPRGGHISREPRRGFNIWAPAAGGQKRRTCPQKLRLHGRHPGTGAGGKVFSLCSQKGPVGGFLLGGRWATAGGRGFWCFEGRRFKSFPQKHFPQRGIFEGFEGIIGAPGFYGLDPGRSLAAGNPDLPGGRLWIWGHPPS